MAVRLLTPGMVFLDNSGQPLDSGKIYTYETGTTTNKTTYTDADAGTPNANPVILDSNGRADIWLDTDVAYRIVVKTSADVTLDTVDGVIGPGTINAVQFADATGISDDSGNEQLIFQKTSTAVNYFEMTNAAAAANPKLSVAGSDSNVGMDFQIKGSTGKFEFNDHNGNEIFFIGPGVTSAVNYTTLINSATGAGPTFTVTGSDANIDMNFQITGTGVYNFKSSSTVAAELRLFEDTSNGSNYVGHKSADSITSSVTYVWPDDGSNGEVLTTDGSGTLAWSSVTTSAAATQAEMETATATNVFVSPGRQQYHPGTVKAWLSFDKTGALNSSYNIDSVTDNGTGEYTITITTDFSTAAYTVVGMGDTSVGTARFVAFDTTQTEAAGTYPVHVHRGDSQALVDPAEAAQFVFLGDQ
jgi:hypothetical protein